LDDLPENSTATDSETALLLANIDSALRALLRTDREDVQKSLAGLEQALHTYGSVKHLLPKLNLTAGQRAPVEKQLQALRSEILAQSPRTGH
jgi:hypothetical protein